MSINRKVMMSDGMVRDLHVITAINHLIGIRTIIDILSVVSSNSDEDKYPLNWRHYIAPCDTTISESDAYEIISNLDKMAEYHDPIDDILPILTDEQAEQLTNLYPSWQADTLYSIGFRVKYEGKLYKCVQEHTSQEGWEPSNAPSLWSRTGVDPEDPTGIPEWIQPTGAQDAYSVGDQVSYNGSVWISLVDANVLEPGVYGWDQLVEEDESEE